MSKFSMALTLLCRITAEVHQSNRNTGITKKFWSEAIVTACYLQNLLPTALNERTPYELWYGKKPSYSKASTVFGSVACMYTALANNGENGTRRQTKWY